MDNEQLPQNNQPAPPPAQDVTPSPAETPAPQPTAPSAAEQPAASVVTANDEPPAKAFVSVHKRNYMKPLLFLVLVLALAAGGYYYWLR
jgi:uncharacterized protein HemX